MSDNNRGRARHYQTIDVLRSESGLVAIITKKGMKNGYPMVSCSIQKEFERRAGGETQRTSFFNERHIDDAHDLLERARERMLKEKEKIAEYHRRRQA